LDAYYARLYGLTREELRYMPYGVKLKEVHGESDVPVNSLIHYIDCWRKT
jgi:hypothetical protein